MTNDAALSIWCGWANSRFSCPGLSSVAHSRWIIPIASASSTSKQTLSGGLCFAVTAIATVLME